MSTRTYQCPCCGGPLSYSGASGKLECASCGNSFDPETMDEMAAQGEKDSISFAAPSETYSAGDAGKMQSYICKNCGAELVTDENTTATECAYCGSPIVLEGRIEGGVKPEKVVPFKVSKEQAEKIFTNYFQGRKLLPNVFLDSRNRIKEMRKLYVPYWLFGCTASGDMTFEAQKRHISRQGDYEVIRTEYYMVRRAGRLRFEDIPVDGSAKIDNRITESLEPYDMREAVPFQPAVLSGAMADNADVDAAECEGRAAQRVAESTAQAIASTVRGYDTVSVRSRNVVSSDGRVTPALMPVWMINTEKVENGQKNVYTFAINGQTGELTCDVPYDKGKATKWFLGVFAGCFVVIFGLLELIARLGVFG